MVCYLQEVFTGGRVKTTGTPVKGFRLKDGKVEKIAGFGLDASAKIAKRKAAKKPRVVAKGKVST